VLRPAHPACADAPKRGRKNHHRQEKEHAHHFKPQDAAHTAEGPQKTAYPARNRPCGHSGHTACGRGILCRGAALGCLVGSGAGSGAAWSCGVLCAGHCALAGDPSRYAQANAQGAANGVWFHPVYDGSSTVAGWFFNTCCSFLSCSRAAAEVR